VHLSLHSEVATLPLSFRDKGIRECFFKINYWGMAPQAVEKVKALVDLGFAGREPVEVSGTEVVPRDLLVALMGRHVPPITDFLAPPANQPPDWTKEIVTEVRGTRDGERLTYRLGTLTLKGALPTGAAPAVAAHYLGQGRVPAGVYPPEQVIDPSAFFRDLEARGIPTQVSVTQWL
jgi:saccharopine dehydrogenase-like NADP-dependent oxidoreductase